jgi:hypothetical protein
MKSMQLDNWETLRAECEARLGIGCEIEPACVLRAVAAHREYWRPEQVRVLLLAESHVMTSEIELAAGMSLQGYGHPSAPSEFVRLVYCLGYGEKELVPAVSPNEGTWQFWKLFAACVGDPMHGQILKGSERNLRRRIVAKIALLEKLKACGVWLLDASPLALYRAGGKKPGSNMYRNALVAGWELYSAEIVRLLAPRAVMVIGKMVHNLLEERLKLVVSRRSEIDWIYQPQAQVSAQVHAEGIRRLRAMVEAHGRPCR